MKPSTKPTPYKHDVSKCIDKILKESKRADPTIDDIEVELSSIQRFGAKPMRFKTGSNVTIYRKTKKGNHKKQKTFISHSYCPFCGAKF